MAEACAPVYTVEIQGCEASGNNTTAISSPHVVQYPRQPKRDDGKWMALGTMLGSIIGKFANGDKLDEASDAEDTWKDLNDKLKEKGLDEWLRVAPERALADAADTTLLNRATTNWTRSETETAYSDQLKACDDKLHELLCQLAQCAYSPDYANIAERAKVDATMAYEQKLKEACRLGNRYNTGINRDVQTSLLSASMGAAIGATTMAREQARLDAFKVRSDLLLRATELFENNRQSRLTTGLQWSNAGTNIQENRYNNHNRNGYDSLKIGADMLASAGQNYAWLAESLRRSAEKDGDAIASLGAMIGILIPLFFGSCSFESKDCTACPKKEPADPTESGETGGSTGGEGGQGGIP